MCQGLAAQDVVHAWAFESIGRIRLPARKLGDPQRSFERGQMSSQVALECDNVELEPGAKLVRKAHGLPPRRGRVCCVRKGRGARVPSA